MNCETLNSKVTFHPKKLPRSIRKLQRVSEQRQFMPEQIKVQETTFAQIAGFAIKKTVEKVDEKHSELSERF